MSRLRPAPLIPGWAAGKARARNFAVDRAARKRCDATIKRLQIMLKAISNGRRTAYAISHFAFPKYTEPFDHWLMLGETLAHLEVLEMRQQIERTHDNGTILFRLAQGKN